MKNAKSQNYNNFKMPSFPLSTIHPGCISGIVYGVLLYSTVTACHVLYHSYDGTVVTWLCFYLSCANKKQILCEQFKKLC